MVTEYILRITDSILAEKLKGLGGLIITGPKWCGITSLAGSFALLCRRKLRLTPMVITSWGMITGGKDNMAIQLNPKEFLAAPRQSSQ